MRRVPLTLSAASAVLLTLTAVSCDDDRAEVTIGEVVRADVREVVDAPATVVTTSVATLTAAADGVLAELRVAPGQRVSAGEVVAVIDSPAAERRLEQAEQALAAAGRGATAGEPHLPDPYATQLATDRSAQAVFDQARDTAERIGDPAVRTALLAQIESARQHYAAVSRAATEALAAARQGLASLTRAVSAIGTAQRLQAQQAYDLAEATVEALTLRAPFDGVVQLGRGGGAPPATGLADLIGAAGGVATGGVVPGGAVAGGAVGAGGVAGAGPGIDPAPAPGAPVAAGAPVVTVVETDDPVLLAQVDETDVLLVEPGVSAEVELDAAPLARYPATVRAVDVLPTPSARGGVSYQVRLDLGEGRLPDGTDAPAPKPGMSAIAHLTVRQAADAVAVPAAAVRRIGEADVVWRVRDGRAEQVEVDVGVAGLEYIEIRSGLQPGDRIVVGGADLVGEGQRLP